MKFGAMEKVEGDNEDDIYRFSHPLILFEVSEGESLSKKGLFNCQFLHIL